MQYPTISEYVKASQDASDNLNMSTEATDEELNEAITDEFGVKYSKDGRKLLKAPQELNGTYPIRKGLYGTYSIKEGTKIICDMAFDSCRSLSSLVIPESVTSIGDSAFRGCRSVYSLVIPDSVTSIGNEAFDGCSFLHSVVISDCVTNIGDYAFRGCKSLAEVVFPNSVTNIGKFAFRHCNFPNDIEQELISRFGEEIFEETF